MYRPGQIVYGDFPFTDEKQEKDRTFLILAIPSPRVVWGVMITSKVNLSNYNETTYLISKSDTTIELPSESAIKMCAIQTVDITKIRKVFCSVNDECFERVMSYIKNILDNTSLF